jgi:hypothetical protein
VTQANTLSEPSPHEEQLAWERRWAPAAAAAAVGSVLAQVVSLVVSTSVARDSPDTNESNEFLVGFRQFNKHESEALVSSLAQALSYALAAAAIYYLFQATRHRRQELSPIFRWLLVVGPILLVAAAVVRHTHTADIVGDFLASGEQTNARAKEIAENNASGLALGLDTGGRLAVALAFLITSLNAMRAGLLTQFMGILGIVVGLLVVLPLGGLGVIQIFWMGALAFLFLDRWPGGRGPAWATGQAEAWPRPARRGMLPTPEGDTRGEGAEPEPMPERPASRKRRKNRD